MGKITAIILIVIFMVFAITIGLLVYQNQKLIQKISPTSSPQNSQVTLTATTSPAPAATVTPKQTLANSKEEISADINEKKFVALESYMANPTVEVVIQSSECCHSLSPKDAAVQVEYISKGIPMDFNQNNPQIIDLKSKYAELAGAYVGLSKNGEQIIAISFDKNNKIAQITMAVSWKIFDFNEPLPSPN